MADLGTLTVNMALEAAQFINGMRQAAAQSQATNRAIASAMDGAKKAVGGLIAVMSIDAFVSASKAAFDYADDIVDLADRTGATTKSIQELRYAAQMTGSDFASADGALEKFAKNLGTAQSGGKAMGETFKDLGVTSSNFDAALRQTIDGISKLPTTSQRNAAALEIFGKSAGTLTALMGEGADGFEEFADKADELGIVLGDDLLRNAGQINDRLDTLKMTLDARFASAIIQNADAIGNLADQVIKIAGAMAQFWGQNPTAAMGIMGALAGGLAGGWVGGLPGALGGAVAGGVGGALIGYNSRGERQRLTSERAGLIDQNNGKNPLLAKIGIDADAIGKGSPQWKKNDARIKTIDARLAALDKEEAAAARLLSGGGDSAGTLPPIAGGKKSGGKSAADFAKEARQALFAYDSDIDAANVSLLSAKQALTGDIVEQSALEREMLSIESDRRKAAIDQDALDGKYTQAQADALKALEDKVVYAKFDLVNLRENEEVARQQLAISQSSLSNDMDLLSSQSGLARSQADRRAISLRLLDLQYQQERLALDAILASKTSTDAEKQIAQARLGVLDRLKANDAAGIRRDTMGPLGVYLDGIPRTGDEIRESMESAAVDGLGSLNDGLREAMKGAGSLADAFDAMGDRIIDKIMDIALQQAILAPIGSLFGSLLGSITGSIAGGTGGGDIVMGGGFTSFMSGARANGGLTRAGAYLVGERGPEIVNVGNTANTIPNHALASVRGGGRSGPTINFGSITSNDPAGVRLMASQAIMDAMPLITQQATSATLTKLRRPGM
ncbi:hypothetical protein [Sphingobium sp. DN12]|uniref:hypothetical protein n=1 Tax=Sphingobium sp. DN12 TaxID=3378073 RepID=UPI003DA48152